MMEFGPMKEKSRLTPVRAVEAGIPQRAAFAGQMQRAVQ